MKIVVVGPLLSSLLIAAAPASFPPPPRGRLASVPGTCETTTVFWVGHRLEDSDGEVNNFGSAITLANGVYGVDYAAVPAVDRSRRGDPVRTCLVSLPRHCPRGDHRGKVFRTTNLKTRETWALPDAEHGCGGA